jgi:hypothetical protein
VDVAEEIVTAGVGGARAGAGELNCVGRCLRWLGGPRWDLGRQGWAALGLGRCSGRMVLLSWGVQKHV